MRRWRNSAAHRWAPDNPARRDDLHGAEPITIRGQRGCQSQPQATGSARQAVRREYPPTALPPFCDGLEFVHAMAYRAGSYVDRTPLMRESEKPSISDARNRMLPGHGPQAPR